MLSPSEYETRMDEFRGSLVEMLSLDEIEELEAHERRLSVSCEADEYEETRYYEMLRGEE